jgi:transcriptional regulator with XRE-family HTH domain
VAGTSIPHYRDRKGLTQMKLAEAVGISEWEMSRIENGISVPTPEQVDKIATKLEALPTQLFTKGMLTVVAERAREQAAS